MKLLLLLLLFFSSLTVVKVVPRNFRVDIAVGMATLDTDSTKDPLAGSGE